MIRNRTETGNMIVVDEASEGRPGIRLGEMLDVNVDETKIDGKGHQLRGQNLHANGSPACHAATPENQARR